jgi:hypothetical protein
LGGKEKSSKYLLEIFGALSDSFGTARDQDPTQDHVLLTFKGCVLGSVCEERR